MSADDEIRRFLDPYDDNAFVGSGGSGFVNLSQVVEHLRIGLERIELDPESGASLTDLIDEGTAYALANAITGPIIVTILMDSAAEIMGRTRPRNYSRLDPLLYDPASLGVHVSEDQLDAAKTLIRYRLNNATVEPGDVPAADTIASTPGGMTALMLLVLTFFTLAVSLFPRET